MCNWCKPARKPESQNTSHAVLTTWQVCVGWFGCWVVGWWGGWVVGWLGGLVWFGLAWQEQIFNRNLAVRCNQQNQPTNHRNQPQKPTNQKSWLCQHVQASKTQFGQFGQLPRTLLSEAGRQVQRCAFSSVRLRGRHAGLGFVFQHQDQHGGLARSQLDHLGCAGSLGHHAPTAGQPVLCRVVQAQRQIGHTPRSLPCHQERKKGV